MTSSHYEIEYKYLVDLTQVDYEKFPFTEIKQAYISVSPVIRIRRMGGDYILTVKGSGEVKHLEYELPLTAEQYAGLLPKAEGWPIQKRRYRIPYFFAGKEYTIELDIFTGVFAGLILAEVEFASEAEAAGFQPPAWFLQNVSHESRYHNSFLAARGPAALNSPQ